MDARGVGASGYTRAVSTLVAGPWGAALLLLFALGLPLQIAVGGLVGLGRRIPALATLALPLLLLLAGLGATVAGLEDAMAALWNPADPPWAPWFALDDRARAAVPAGLAGLGAAVLTLPVALGAAYAGARASTRRLRLVFGLGLPGALGVGLAGLGAALLLDGGLPLVLPSLGGPIFVLAAFLAAAPPDARRFTAVTSGCGAAVIGVVGLALAAACAAAADTASALGDYAAPFAALDGVVASTRAAWRLAGTSAFLAVAFSGLVVPAAAWRPLRRVDPAHGLDAFASVSLGLMVLLVAGWGVARARVLSHLAGAHAADVLKHAPGYAVPAREPLPTRVLVGESATPRWIMMRDRGGVDRLPIAGGLEIVGPALLLNDGLMLSPTLPLEDFYLGLFESGAGRVAIVGCERVSPDLAADILWDPLLAVGRCASFPLTLRVTTRLSDPRVLIVLKDGFVDDGGDVKPLGEVGDITGRDVIVRGQVDATVADLVAMLHLLAPAGRVYLGHGVTLDGDDLPIGVDPGLRITRLPQDRAAETAAAAAAAASADMLGEPAPD